MSWAQPPGHENPTAEDKEDHCSSKQFAVHDGPCLSCFRPISSRARIGASGQTLPRKQSRSQVGCLDDVLPTPHQPGANFTAAVAETALVKLHPERCVRVTGVRAVL